MKSCTRSDFIKLSTLSITAAAFGGFIGCARGPVRNTPLPLEIIILVVGTPLILIFWPA